MLGLAALSSCAQTQDLGFNFNGATGVTFNGVAATTFSVVDDNTIHANVPASATSGKITAHA